MRALAATAHIGIVINSPSEQDIANLQELIKMIMTLVSFFIIVWRELQPLIIFVVSVLDVLETTIKIVAIVWNIIKFL